MPKAPYRIIYCDPQAQFSTWEFDETEFETAEAAFDVALKEYEYCPFRVVKLCYPKED